MSEDRTSSESRTEGERAIAELYRAPSAELLDAPIVYFIAVLVVTE